MTTDAVPRRRLSHRSRLDHVKIAHWTLVLYAHLWILEGALRKWIPFLGEAMYVARDGLIIAAILLLLAIPSMIRRKYLALLVVVLIFLVGGAVAVMSERLPLTVMLVGLRSYLAPLLALFIYLSYRPPAAGRSIARVILAYVPLQAVIGAAQALSPPTAWINRQVSGDEAHFVSDGIVRISGTFSSPSGIALFVAIAFSIVAGALLARSNVATRARLISTGMLLIALCTISGSRGAVLGVICIILTLILAAFFTAPGHAVKTASVTAVGAAVAYAGAWLVFPSVLSAFLTRFEDASRNEAPLERLFRQTFGFIDARSWALFGDGIGARSQAGIAVGSGLPWVEIDSLRWVIELGLVGLVLATIRVGVAFALVLRIVLRSRQDGWVRVALYGALVPMLLWGSISQNPTDQGAFVILVVLSMSAWTMTDAPDRAIVDGASTLAVRGGSRRPGG